MSSMGRLAGVALLCMLGAGCTRKGIEPMPHTMNTEGAILRTEVRPIGGAFFLEDRQVLVSPFWNDFYPLNYASAEPVENIVSRLFVSRGNGQEFVAWASLRGERGWIPNVSPKGDRILFDTPEVSPEDGQFPREYDRGVRPRAVMVYSVSGVRPLKLKDISGVHGLSRSSYWRPDGRRAAFTGFCRQPDCEQWGLVVVGYGGDVVHDATDVPALGGLEFIAWSPDGKKIAALRPAEVQADGVGGGELVEFDPETRELISAGRISPELVADHLGRLEQVVAWKNNRLGLAPPKTLESSAALAP